MGWWVGWLERVVEEVGVDGMVWALREASWRLMAFNSDERETKLVWVT